MSPKPNLYVFNPLLSFNKNLLYISVNRKALILKQYSASTLKTLEIYDYKKNDKVEEYSN